MGSQTSLVPAAHSVSRRLPLLTEKTIHENVFNVRGTLVKTLVNEKISAGAHTAVWDGKDQLRHAAPSGYYIYKLNANRSVGVR
jgi:flagellar hook assembly protein FlgD